MSYILKHSPWIPDDLVFIGLDEFVKALKNVYPWVEGEHVRTVVELDPKGRFEIRDGKIRARYGHG